MKTHLDLFSGVGGFALAAHWAGYRTVAFVEIEPYAQAVLREHWPGVPIFENIFDLTVDKHEWHKSNRAIPRGEVMPRETSDVRPVELLTAGFP